MSLPTITRGQPLLVLTSILGAWLVGRVLFWNPLHPHTIISSPGAPPADKSPEAFVAADAERSIGWQVEGVAFVGGEPASTGSSAAPSASQSVTGTARSPAKLSPRADYSPARRAAGRQRLLSAALGQGILAGLARQPPPGAAELMGGSEASLAMFVADRPLLGAPTTPAEARPARLSGDSWLLWRGGSAVAGPPTGPTYGRSQAGAVIRYRLLAGHAHVPEVYTRATRTLEGSPQTEFAAGLSLRPLIRVPLAVAAEARVTETASGRELRPAAFAVAQLPPLALPFGLQGEAYVQGGYVGGSFSTPFVDGQARIDGRLVQIQNDDYVRLGLAAWGGAQEGAARLDVGPSAALAFNIGDARARIAVDYRVRVAGKAAPADGPAVTFSAGF